MFWIIILKIYRWQCDQMCSSVANKSIWTKISCHCPFNGASTKRPSKKKTFYETSFHKMSFHVTSFSTKRPFFKTSIDTKRPWIQNVLLYKTSNLQNVHRYKTSMDTNRPSLQKCPSMQNVLHFSYHFKWLLPPLSDIIMAANLLQKIFHGKFAGLVPFFADFLTSNAFLVL